MLRVFKVFLLGVLLLLLPLLLSVVFEGFYTVEKFENPCSFYTQLAAAAYRLAKEGEKYGVRDEGSQATARTATTHKRIGCAVLLHDPCANG